MMVIYGRTFANHLPYCIYLWESGGDRLCGYFSSGFVDKTEKSPIKYSLLWYTKHPASCVACDWKKMILFTTGRIDVYVVFLEKWNWAVMSLIYTWISSSMCEAFYCNISRTFPIWLQESFRTHRSRKLECGIIRTVKILFQLDEVTFPTCFN